jgi:hypothetical protein
MTHARRSFRALGAAILFGSITACYTSEPAPAYTEPAPAPRALRVTAQRKQSQNQQNRDKAECQNLASAQASSSQAWAQIFASCMGGRGYMVE